ncbi:MAG TPA: hypothetical protein DDY18_11950 [Flavobacterium sp.]|jgi:hypothetical protein|nr:hypothetical protein [Flavobacterium sp.]
MVEKWTNFFISVECGDQKYHLKVVHYFDNKREWYRVFAEGFNRNYSAALQFFGYGTTFEKALEDFYRRTDILTEIVDDQ